MPPDGRQSGGQIPGDKAGAKMPRGFAMHPDGGGDGLKRWHVLSEQARNHAGQNVAGAGG